MNRAELEQSRIRATSYAYAVEQALHLAEAGYSPRKAIEVVEIAWGFVEPDWDDAVYALAFAWRRNCIVTPEPAGPVEPPPDLAFERRMRNCLKCRVPFMSDGPSNQLCAEHRRENQGINSALAEGVVG